jgi:hypothetical protein
VIVDFVEKNRDSYGVERILVVVPTAPATYYERRASRLDPDKRPARAKRDEALVPEIQRVHDENQEVYGKPRRSGGGWGAKASPWHAARSRD